MNRKADFGDFGGVTYLNCAYHGATPNVASEAAARAIELKRNPSLIRDEYHFSFPDNYRAAAARLINGRPEDVAVTGSATDGAMILVNGLDWRDGDEIVMPRGEFPSNLFTFRSLKRKGVVIREVPVLGCDAGLEAFEAAISERTRLVVASWVSFTTGFRIEVDRLAEICRRRGALLYVDGSQAVGGIPTDVSKLGCSLLAVAGYKWLLNPYGTGFAWVSPALSETLALANINWFSIAGARDFNRLSECSLTFESGARRFDRNEPASFFNTLVGARAIQYLLEVTPEAVEKHVHALQDRLIAGLPDSYRVVSPTDPRNRSNIVCIASDDPQKTDGAFAALLENDVRVSRREGRIRFSPHVYNDESDIDRCLEVLVDLEAGISPRPRGLPRGVRVLGSQAEDPPRILEGSGVSLVPVDPVGQVAALFACSHGDQERNDIWTYMGYGPFENVDSMKEWLSECSASNDPIFYTVLETGTSKPVGVVSYLNIDRSMRRLETGHIWFGVEAQRTRVNTEVAYLMLKTAFDLGFRRIEWKCDALNERSRRAALRLGFQFEGVFRKHLIVKGRNRDTAWYSMTDDDWPKNRIAIERWLKSDAGSMSLTAMKFGEEGSFR